MKHSFSAKKLMSEIEDYKLIRKNQISKMKKELKTINPYKIIEDAIKTADTYIEKTKNKTKKDDLLEQTRINAVSSFITDIKGKNEIQIQKIFEKKIEEYTNSTQIIIDKFKKENKKYVSKFEAILEEKKLLLDQLAQLNSEYDNLKAQFKDNEQLIYKLQIRFSIFKENKVLFDEFLKEFSNRNPIDVIKEIQTRQDGFVNFLNEYNNAMQKIDDLKKEKNDEYKINKRTIEELSDKLYQKEIDTKGITESHEKEILNLKNEISAFKGYKEQNIMLHKMLFRLYNRLIEAFGLEKKIKIDNKFLNIQECDFKPNLFDDSEIGRYIDLMISAMNKTSTDDLLRETIAYSNMMVRLYMKDQINLRYEPVRTFKELKNLMERKEEDIFKLKEKVKDLELKNSQLEINNKKLSSSIKHIHSQMNLNLRNKRMLNKKYESVSKEKVDLSLKKNNFRKVPINEMNEKNKVSSAKNILENSFRKRKGISVGLSKKESKEYDKTYDFKNEGLLTPEEREKFRNIYESKNSDKLIKIHGFQDLVTHLNEFRELVDHTNRLFLYQSKMNAGNNHFISYEKLNNSIKKRRPFSTSKSVCYEDRIKNNIIKKLDGMIKKVKDKK